MQKATECEGTETAPEQLVMADFESLLRVVFFYLRVRVSFPTSARWWHFLAKKKWRVTLSVFLAIRRGVFGHRVETLQ